jgi:GNAT superfamily N-acetyltransferase
MEFSIHELEQDRAAEHMAGLVELLDDAIDDGASLGYVGRPSPQVLRDYWQEVISQVEPEHLALLAALDEKGRVAGSVQLVREGKPNGRHRAEVRKLLVHRNFRRHGLGCRLMEELQDQAKSWGLGLLLLDTATGEPAEVLYKNMGYVCFGLVPDYASYPDGGLHEVSFFYKRI